MAPPQRTTSSSLVSSKKKRLNQSHVDESQGPLMQHLYAHTYLYDFPQAVRLLQRGQPSQKLGDNEDVRFDPVHFEAHIGLGVNTGDLKQLHPGSPPKLTVSFLGIAGIQGPLPEVFTEILIDRIKLKENAFKDFLDIFNHRLITFWFKFYTKLYPGLTDQVLENTEVGESLMDLGGVRHQIKSDCGEGLAPFATLFWQRSGSMTGLQKIIESYFNIR